MAGRKPIVPFDKRGGVIVVSRNLLESRNYRTLTPYAKSLMVLMQIHWRNDKPVDYGIEEASQKIPCDRRTAMKAFKQLQDRGFITCVAHSMFNSRTQSKSRSWRLEWMPYEYGEPRNVWEKWRDEN